jgi:glutaminyl-peptide cyclotransferase
LLSILALPLRCQKTFFVKLKPRSLFAFLAIPAISLVTINISCGDPKPGDSSGLPTENTVSNVKSIGYTVEKIYDHDGSSFTQGLQWVNNQLLEGTGEYGESKLLLVDLKTGKPNKSVAIDKQYFGEGVTQLKDTIYQLTWKEKTCLVYDAKTFKQVKTFNYNTEGWGITNDGQQLIMSDGSNNLYFIRPADFRTTQVLSVTKDGTPVGNLNELEYIKGYLYANVWQTNYIIKIEPQSGHVVGMINLENLLAKTGKKPADNSDDVLNGIAYDSVQNKIYITGKNWPALYEVKFDN